MSSGAMAGCAGESVPPVSFERGNPAFSAPLVIWTTTCKRWCNAQKMRDVRLVSGVAGTQLCWHTFFEGLQRGWGGKEERGSVPSSTSDGKLLSVGGWRSVISPFLLLQARGDSAELALTLHPFSRQRHKRAKKSQTQQTTHTVRAPARHW